MHAQPQSHPRRLDFIRSGKSLAPEATEGMRDLLCIAREQGYLTPLDIKANLMGQTAEAEFEAIEARLRSLEITIVDHSEQKPGQFSASANRRETGAPGKIGRSGRNLLQAAGTVPGIDQGPGNDPEQKNRACRGGHSTDCVSFRVCGERTHLRC